jgi:transposase
MPRGTELTEFEKGQIQAYNDAGKSNREIARLLRRSEFVVRNFLKNPEAYGTRKRSGRPSKVSERDKRRIYRAASNSTASSSKIKRDLGLNVHPKTIRRVISKNPNLVRRKMKRAPALKEVHKRQRLEFARRNMNKDWSKVSCFWPMAGLAHFVF